MTRVGDHSYFPAGTRYTYFMHFILRTAHKFLHGHQERLLLNLSLNFVGALKTRQTLVRRKRKKEKEKKKKKRNLFICCIYCQTLKPNRDTENDFHWFNEVYLPDYPSIHSASALLSTSSTPTSG